MFVIPYTTQYTHRARHLAAPAFGRTLDRLFDESFERAVNGRTAETPSRTPAMDVTESDTAYTIAFEVPGVAREQLKVSVDGRRVDLETVDLPATEAKQGEAATAQARVLYRERSATRYVRSVSLPAEVDQTTSQAKFDNGVLTLTLAKRVPAGATQLNIG